MNADNEPSPLYTIQDIAEYLRVSTKTVAAVTYPRGPLRCIRVGPRGVRYTRTAVEEFIREQENAEPQTEA